MPLLDYDNSTLDTNLKESQVMHIPFDEHFSLKNTKDGTIIEFRDRHGKMHKARVSKWHLCPVWGLDLGHPYHNNPVLRAVSVLRKELGNLAFAKYDHAASVYCELVEKHEFSPECDKAQIAQVRAFLDILLCSEISLIALPMMMLAHRGEKFKIAQEAWQFRHPPEYLRHLSPKGFTGKSRLGILAYGSHSSRDCWVVDQFDDEVSAKDHPDYEQIRAIVEDAFSSNQYSLASTSKTKSRHKRASLVIRTKEFVATHSFRKIVWRGDEYSISKNAGGILETLYYLHTVHRLKSVPHDDLLSEVFGSQDRSKWSSRNARIDSFFRQNDAKRLWDARFINHRSGKYFLDIDLESK